MKYKHIEPQVKKKKPMKRPKKNNAHLIPKDKLFLQAFNLEIEIVQKQRGRLPRLPIKYY